MYIIKQKQYVFLFIYKTVTLFSSRNIREAVSIIWGRDTKSLLFYKDNKQIKLPKNFGADAQEIISFLETA